MYITILIPKLQFNNSPRTGGWAFDPGGASCPMVLYMIMHVDLHVYMYIMMLHVICFISYVDIENKSRL